MSAPFGEKHGKARLSDREVRNMRALRAKAEAIGHTITYRELAEIFRCGAATARDIVKFRTRASA